MTHPYFREKQSVRTLNLEQLTDEIDRCQDDCEDVRLCACLERQRELREGSAWISVNDRLPTEGQHVDIYCATGRVVECMCLSVDPKMTGERFVRWDNQRVAYGNVSGVTHWMPTPEPPQCPA